MVSESYHIRSGFENIIRLFGRYPDDIRVFAVNNTEPDIVFFFECFQLFPKTVKAGLPANVSDSKYLYFHLGPQVVSK
jgi:hypothetical protein